MRPSLRCLLVAAAVAAVAARSAMAQEHLPARSKPPLAGERPAGLPGYGQRLGTPAPSEADRAFDRSVWRISRASRS